MCPTFRNILIPISLKLVYLHGLVILEDDGETMFRNVWSHLNSGISHIDATVRSQYFADCLTSVRNVCFKAPVDMVTS